MNAQPTLEPAPSIDDASGKAASTWKAVYTIVERGDRKHWLRIGVAFLNRDGSLNVRLDALPCNGQLHIRESLPRDPHELNDRASLDRVPPERSTRTWRE